MVCCRQPASLELTQAVPCFDATNVYHRLQSDGVPSVAVLGDFDGHVHCAGHRSMRRGSIANCSGGTPRRIVACSSRCATERAGTCRSGGGGGRCICPQPRRSGRQRDRVPRSVIPRQNALGAVVCDVARGVAPVAHPKRRTGDVAYDGAVHVDVQAADAQHVDAAVELGAAEQQWLGDVLLQHSDGDEGG